MDYKKIFIIVLFLSIFSYIAILKLNEQYESSVKIKYNHNHEWMLNNNVIQYSSYIIVDPIKNDTFRVEGYLHWNYRKMLSEYDKEIFICLLKNTRSNEILPLDIAENPRYHDQRNRKFIFKFEKEDFNSSTSFDVNHIVVAIIKKVDYNSSLDDSPVSKILNDESKTIVLPYSMLNFQKPTVIYTNEPRLPGVGLSVHYTYQLQNYTVAWVRSQFELGIAEMVLYDATENFELTKLLKENIPNEYKLIIHPFDVSENGMCNEIRLVQQHYRKKGFSKIKNFMKKICKIFYWDEFQHKIDYDWRVKHEYMTQNDGFTQLGQKYEFYAQYDMDEYIYPHTLNHDRDQFLKQNFTCDKICKTKTLLNESINIYDYVKSVINGYSGPNDKNKDRIRSVFFAQALYITSDEILNKLMIDIDRILSSGLYNGTAKIILFDANDSNAIFEVSKNDFDYMRNLSYFYTNLLKCNFKINHKNDEKSAVHEQFQKYFYLVDDSFGHWGKSIHISKLTKTISTHFSFDYELNTWILNANINEGNLLSHFRMNLNQYLFHNRFVTYKTGNITRLRVSMAHILHVSNRFKFC